MIGYFNKKGALIKRTEWNQRIKAKSYRYYRHYDNGDIQVVAEWHGVGDRDAMPEDRKIFRLVVSNMVGTKWVKDISLSEDFSSEQTMIERYEGILLEHTKCFLNDDFEFEEVGNVAPPIPKAKKKVPAKPEPRVVESTPPELVPDEMKSAVGIKDSTDEEIGEDELEEIMSVAPATSSASMGGWS